MPTATIPSRRQRVSAENPALEAEGWLPTPIGPLRLAASAKGLVGIRFTDAGATPANLGKPEPTSRDAPARIVREARAQLEAYFTGDRPRFDLPLDPEGTAFQRKVWRALARVPIGRTVSYAELGARVGSPAGARAIGLAMATNPIPVVIPCHRVLRSDGSLGGFGGGLWRKRFLLEHEQRLRASARSGSGARARHTVVA